MRNLSLSALCLALTCAGAAASHARDISFVSAPITGGHVVLPVGKDASLTAEARTVDEVSGGLLQKALKAAQFDGAKHSSKTFHALGPFDSITVIGTGDGSLSRTDAEDFGGHAAALTAGIKSGTVHILPPSADSADEVATGAALRRFNFDSYKSKKAEAQAALQIVTKDAAQLEKQWPGDGAALADGVNFARGLIWAPSNIKTPQWFVEQVQARFKGMKNVEIDVLDVAAMQKLGMGAILGSGQGSLRPPRMLVVQYKGGKANDKPVVITGKGITFDSGGISIKPGEGMWRMRYDMAGAAASMGTLLTVAHQQLPVNVVAIAALAENMPDGGAIRPGDVLTAMSGKTIEIISTDAEGRLVLADASWYAQTRWQPRAQISIATLTGAARAALGSDFAALMSRDDSLSAALIKAGDNSGEKLWRMPLIDAHAKAIKSDIADIKNGVEGGNAGMSTGAQFIAEFIKPETPWAHLDIAGMAWSTTDSATTPKGAVGFGVRLLSEYIRETSKTQP